MMNINAYEMYKLAIASSETEEYKALLADVENEILLAAARDEFNITVTFDRKEVSIEYTMMIRKELSLANFKLDFYYSDDTYYLNINWHY